MDSMFGHILFVSVSIALVSAPFVGHFWWQHRAEIRAKRPPFNHFMENFFSSRQLNWLVFFWALSEALIWFVIPEFLLFLIIFMRVKHKTQLLWYDIAGTIAGSIIGLCFVLPHSVFLQIPFVYQKMLDTTHAWYEQLGVWALIHQPFSGVPYKVFLFESHAFSFNLFLFIALALLLRVGRYALAYGLFLLGYPVLHRFVYRHYAILLALAVVIFSLMLMKVSYLYS
jgi:hypothetical protein